jgi:hypothetical protein
MIKYKTEKVINMSDWDNLVMNTYGRRYCFQQQDGCQSRGTHYITIPEGNLEEYDFPNDSIPEIVNGNEMGVSFKAWLERDPNQPIPNQTSDFQLELFYQRNFYPNIQVVANDLHAKGLIEAGDYTININW